MAEAAKVPALGRRCAVGHGGTGGKQKRYLVMARSESLFGWEKVYTESCTQRCKEMKGKKKKTWCGKKQCHQSRFPGVCALCSRILSPDRILPVVEINT